MATIPTTDCSFGDIVIAYNTTFPSTPVSTNNINLKTSFSEKTVYNPGWPLVPTVIPSSNISTSLFYGKTFQMPVPTVTFSSPVVVAASAGNQSWNNPTITSDTSGTLYVLYTESGSILTVRTSTNSNASWSAPGDDSGNIDISGDIPGGWGGQYSITTGVSGNVYIAYGKNDGLWFYQQNQNWTATATFAGPWKLITGNTPPGAWSDVSANYVSMAVTTDSNGDDHFYISYTNENYHQLMFLTQKQNNSYNTISPTPTSTMPVVLSLPGNANP